MARNGRSASLPTLPSLVKPKIKRASEVDINPIPSHRLRSMPEQSNDYRVVVFGAGGVGKSSLVLRFIKGTFKETYVPTIEDTYRQVINCDKNICTLQITDTTGSHHFPAMQRLSITRGHAFILVFSITSRQTLAELMPIYEQIKSLKPSMQDVPLILIGNKCDELERDVPAKEGESIARSWDCPFLETSAKNNYNVQEVFQQLLELEKSRNMSLNSSSRQRKTKADKHKEKLKSSCTIQ